MSSYFEDEVARRGTSSLNFWDVWCLRAGLEIYGFYCFTFILNPLFKKVFIQKTHGLFELMLKHTRFFVLCGAGACIAAIFPFYDLMPHRVWFTSISFFVGLFALTETYISYGRLPFKLLAPRRTKLTQYIVIVSVSLMVLRSVFDIIIFIFLFTGPDKKEVYIFAKILRIVSGTMFTVSEFWVSKITFSVIATPREDLTADMKLQLKDTKGKLEQLAMANYVGGISALVDIANHWVELQIAQTFVCLIGSTAYIFYGNLFRLSLQNQKEYAASRGSMKTTASIIGMGVVQSSGNTNTNSVGARENNSGQTSSSSV